jgi:putative Holliday junction resolvase
MLSFAEAAARLPPRTPIVGLDLGTKTIGVAISDLTRQIASPLETIVRKKFSIDAANLLAIVAREKTGVIVLGLPLNLDGTEGPRAQSTRAFARNLERLTNIPIVFWDERLSTMAVEKAMIEAGASRAKRADHIDKLAAAYILQSALDSLR